MDFDYRNTFNSEKALIWRIIHRNNLPWALQNGLHSCNSNVKDPNYINIGNRELIDRRASRAVPILPNGTLNDYVPFYFTPFSPMMFNIHTGRGGVIRRSNDEILILVSSLNRLAELDLPFIFTDRHAYTSLAQYFSDFVHLGQIDWPLLQARNFQRDPNDPEKIERYQADALIHRHLPINALVGIICYSDSTKAQIIQQSQEAAVKLEIYKKPEWYFS